MTLLLWLLYLAAAALEITGLRLAGEIIKPDTDQTLYMNLPSLARKRSVAACLVGGILLGLVGNLVSIYA